MVPPLTESVLTRFGDDERTVREFSSGGHSLQIYSGDIAAQHEAEAELATAFRAHPLAGIRKWAEYEIASGRSEALRWRQMDEERSTE